jgi:hypothetical protein
MVAIAEAGGSVADIAFAKTNPLKSVEQMDLLELL